MPDASPGRWYRYRALRSDGRLRVGVRQAGSPALLDHELASEGLELLHCRPAWRPTPAGRPLALDVQAEWCFQMGEMLAAGIPLLDALGEVRDSAPAGLASRLTVVIADIDAGAPLSAALAPHASRFDALLLPRLRAGELSGDLAAAFRELHGTLGWQADLASRQRQALLYPLCLGIVIAATGLFLMLFVVPQVADFARRSGQALAWHSRLLFAAADGLRVHGAACLATLAGVLMLGGAMTRLPGGRRGLAALRLRLPVAGPLLRQLSVARFARAFASLYAAGVPVQTALACLDDALPAGPLREALNDSARRVQAGQRLGDAFAAHPVFPRLFIRLLKVGEQTGRLDRTLAQASDLLERQGRAGLERMHRLSEPALTLALGLFLGWIALSVMGPIQDFIGRAAG